MAFIAVIFGCYGNYCVNQGANQWCFIYAHSFVETVKL